MATKAELFRSELERSKPPRPKHVVKAARAERTAQLKADRGEAAPAKSVRGSEHARQMKSQSAAFRHDRRSH